MKSKLLFPLVVAVMAFNADAAVQMIQNNNVVNNGGTDTAVSYDWRNDSSYQQAQQEDAEIAILEEDIRILDEELEKCKKKKKGWTAATIVGGVGVVSTGVAAIVQANKIKDKKAEHADKKAEYTAKQQELTEAKKQ